MVESAVAVVEKRASFFETTFGRNESQRTAVFGRLWWDACFEAAVDESLYSAAAERHRTPNHPLVGSERRSASSFQIRLALTVLASLRVVRSLFQNA